MNAENKQTILESLTQKVYTLSEVKDIVTKVPTKMKVPKDLRKGDIILVRVTGKTRPAVVMKIVDGVVYSITLTTTEDHMTFAACNSRFLEGSFFTTTICANSMEYSRGYFTGVYDNPKHLNKVIKELKEYYLTKIF